MRTDQIKLPVTVRSEVGKTASRRLRKEGKIPAVIYGRDAEPLPLAVDEATFRGAIPATALYSSLIRLQIKGEGKRRRTEATVMIKEVQRDLVERRFLSIDFRRTSLTESIQTPIPVVHVGESPGVKIGGILEHLTHEVVVECLPSDVPDHLETDVSELEIGDSLRVKDLVPPPGVSIVTPEDDVVIVVSPPAVIEEEAPAEEEEGAVVEEAAEPEVLTERQREPEEENE